MDEILQHFETHENPCWLFTGESSVIRNRGFFEGAKWDLSIHFMCVLFRVCGLELAPFCALCS